MRHEDRMRIMGFRNRWIDLREWLEGDPIVARGCPERPSTKGPFDMWQDIDGTWLAARYGIYVRGR